MCRRTQIPLGWNDSGPWAGAGFLRGWAEGVARGSSPSTGSWLSGRSLWAAGVTGGASGTSALVAMVAGKDLGGAALMYYLVAYGLMTLGAFSVVLAVGRKGEPNEEFGDYAGLGFRYPALGMAMTIFMLSLTGVPPLVGFIGKFYIFSAAVKAGYVWLAVIGVLNSVVSAYYYIRVVVSMYMYEGEKMPELLSARPALAAAILLAAIGTVAMGVFPAASIALAKVSFLSLG